MNFVIIIPARFSSKRLPGKPLKKINGKSMILHVMEQSLNSNAKRVIVATDNIKIYKEVKKENGEVVLTKKFHKSGTERISEVIDIFNFKKNQIIINIQGDEPLISPEIINKIAINFIKNYSNVETLAIPINNKQEINNNNVVKLISDINNNAIYFFRSYIPFLNKKEKFFLNNINEIKKNIFKHIGIYAYTAGFIRNYVSWTESFIEKIESLEQLRILNNGKKIHVTFTDKYNGLSVDTKEDLENVRKIFNKKIHNI